MKLTLVFDDKVVVVETTTIDYTFAVSPNGTVFSLVSGGSPDERDVGRNLKRRQHERDRDIYNGRRD